MLRMMDSEKGFFGPINVGNPGEFTMLELAEKVLRLTASKSRLVHKALPADDPKQRRPDIIAGAHEARLGTQGRARGRPRARPSPIFASS